MKKLELVVEFNDGLFWGYVELKSDFLPTSSGETLDELKNNIRMVIQDYKENEGVNDATWANIDPDTVEFNCHYDLRAFFKTFKAVSLTAVAEAANINRSLLNQYATGTKLASLETVTKVEKVIHALADELKEVKLFCVENESKR